MPSYKLISFQLCPFVQRSVVTLEETGTPYEIEYIDLSDKPDWFLALSPFGKVPVLQVGDAVLFESSVINEYLDEVSEVESLHPQEPLEKAKNRSTIEYISALLGDQFRLTVAKDEESYAAAAKGIREKLERLEGQVQGPLYNGSGFSLVDASMAPYFQRALWCAALDPSLQSAQGLPKIQAWQEALLSRKSVQDSIVPNLHDLFVNFLKGDRGVKNQTEPSFLGKKAA